MPKKHYQFLQECYSASFDAVIEQLFHHQMESSVLHIGYQSVIIRLYDKCVVDVCLYCFHI